MFIFKFTILYKEIKFLTFESFRFFNSLYIALRYNSSVRARVDVFFLVRTFNIQNIST